jgi:hypothetical protein
LFINDGRSLAVARNDGFFYAIPMSADVIKSRICRSNSLLPSSEWLKYITTVQPKDLCTPK